MSARGGKRGKLSRVTTRTVDVRTVTRRSNPRRRPRVHTAKWDRCVVEVKRRGGAASPQAVCTARLGERGSIVKRHRRRRTNPRPRLHMIVAVKGGRRLKYTGNKFARVGRATLFPSARDARSVAYWLEILFARELKGWKLEVVS